MSLIKFISQMLSKQKLKKLPVNYGVIWFHRFASNAALESERMFPPDHESSYRHKSG